MIQPDTLTWEQAVQWLRDQPDQQALVRACYYDDPLLQAAERFANSAEWQAVRRFLPSAGVALDLGAGRGIGAYALARDGWHVVALEPDPSTLVGAGAIRQLTLESHLPITIVQEHAEMLSFADDTFDLVYSRQLLHHAGDLMLLCREAVRTLSPGGRFIATREPIVSRLEDKAAFLNNHPLHKFYGGEDALLLEEYTSGITVSGLRLVRVLKSFDSAINYFPLTHEEWRAACQYPLARLVGKRPAQALTNDRLLAGRWLLQKLATWCSQRDQSPGRLYSFVAEKPS